jgi:hypothetical protein
LAASIPFASVLQQQSHRILFFRIALWNRIALGLRHNPSLPRNPSLRPLDDPD